MFRWTLLLGLLLACNTYATDDDKIIKDMARTSSLSEAQIRAYYKTGCDSGDYVPMLVCATFRYLSADLELNEKFKALLGQLTTKPAKSSLIKAQKAWIPFRDATCEYETEGNGGRFWSVHNLGCLITVTEERVGKLKQYLECKTPGCPGEW
jgi:uncharacterized protein YecT (DUF1311 family)